MTPESQRQNQLGGVTEATPLLAARPSTTTTQNTIVTASPDNNNNNNDDTNGGTNTGGSNTNHRPKRRTLRRKHPKDGDDGMDTSDGSRESTTSSIYSHLQSFREVSLRLIQYVAHHSGTIHVYIH